MAISPVPMYYDTAGLGGGPYTAKFLVENFHEYDVDVSLSCSATSGLSCGTVTPSSINIPASSASDTIRVSYTVSTVGAKTMTLTGYHDAESASPVTGVKFIQVTGAPTVTLQVPAGTTRAVVATRQPIIRAFFGSVGGGGVDTTKTVLQWRGSTVTSLARHNRGLLEWEVDSTRALGLTGDSALVSVTACTAANQCTVVTRWAVLPNDDTPVVGFTGMPLGSLGSGYGAPFGPGLAVHQAEVETGFSIPSYISMGAPRSAGLVYSTRQSYPRALVLVDLDVRWPVGTPDQIKLLLKDGGVTLDSLQLASPTCATGAARRCRASLQADYAGTTFATPTRKWLKVEARITSGVTTKSSVDSVEVVLVDRRATAYGSGWWPAGVSQLVASGSDRLLIGPTGTATIYRGNGDTLYLPPPGVFTGLTKVSTRWEIRPRGSLAYILFNSDGKVGSSVDANGNRDSVAYDGSGRVAKFRDPLTKEITFTYDGNGKLSLIEDAASRDSKISINPSTYELTYDSLSSPTSKPARTSFTYQSYGGATGTLVLTKRLGTILDTTIVTYDARRRPTQVDLPSVINPATGSLAKPVIGYVAYEQRGNGALVSLDSTYVQMTDPRGFWTKALLTRWGQAARSWDELGLLGKSTYDPDGFLLWSEGKNGDSSRTYQVYDAVKRAVKSYIVRAAGDTLRGDSLVYDASHRVIQTVDNRGKSTYLTYDVKSNVIVVKTPNGDSTRTWYRSDGLVDSVRQPNAAAAQRYTYEATWKQVERVMDPSGDTLGVNYYDALGRLDSTVSKIKGDTLTGREWRKTRPYYNTANQVDSSVTLRASVAGGGGPTWPSLTDTLNTTWVRSRFDAAGRDSLRINNRGKATLYLFDRLGRLVSRRPWTDSSAVKDSMVYDLAGNVIKTITRRGDTLTANFDQRNRDTLSVIPTVGTVRKTFGGPLDQLTRVWIDSFVDSIGGINPSRAWRYDQRGRLLSDTSYTGSTARTLVYAYDTYERNYRTTDAIGQWDMEYETNRGYPIKLKTPLADTVSYTWDTRSRPVGPTVSSNGVKVTVTPEWNEAGALKQISTWLGSTQWLAGKWTNLGQTDANAPVKSRWYEKLGNGAATDSTTTFAEYDGWERLDDWTTLHSAPNQDQTYAFDATGNIVGWTYDGTTDRLTLHGADSLRYDRAGNLVQKISGGVTWVYGYDALNRLVSARRGGTLIARYAYDIEGRRIAKRVYSSASGGAVGYTRFVYRAAHVGFETDSAGTIGMRYVWGLSVDDLIAFEDGAGNHYYVAKDKVGSTRNVATRSGTWVMRLRHRPYGTLIDSVGAGVMLRYRWTGREWDAELGWYHLRTRNYDPVLSRFTQEDPIGFAGGDNLYAYVGGSPLQARDPNGLKQGNVDGPFEGFCFGGGSCVNWDGTVTHASGWGTGGGGGGWGFNSLLGEKTRFETRCLSWTVVGGVQSCEIQADDDKPWNPTAPPPEGWSKQPDVRVGCRPVNDLIIGAVANHCAIRVRKGDTVVSAELLESNSMNQIVYHRNRPLGHEALYVWWGVRGVSATAVLEALTLEILRNEGREYHADGLRNSNRFVFDVITRAGATLPYTTGFGPAPFTPGICGGNTTFPYFGRGSRCR